MRRDPYFLTPDEFALVVQFVAQHLPAATVQSRTRPGDGAIRAAEIVLAGVRDPYGRPDTTLGTITTRHKSGHLSGFQASGAHIAKSGPGTLWRAKLADLLPAMLPGLRLDSEFERARGATRHALSHYDLSYVPRLVGSETTVALLMYLHATHRHFHGPDHEAEAALAEAMRQHRETIARAAAASACNEMWNHFDHTLPGAPVPEAA